MRLLFRLFGAALAACLGAACLGEVVHMKDGRVFEGEITKETSSSITIRTKVSGIETTLTLRRRNIDRIEASAPRGPGGSDDAAEAAREELTEADRVRSDRPSRRERDEERMEPSFYIEVPIEGTFGQDVIPSGVADALEYAERRGIEHIVFRIDSPGGYVAAANEISDALREYDAALTYHAIVEDAISAAIWVALMCDTIHMAPGSSIGGAVVFSQDESTGAAEVDAKMNSIIAANLASNAAARGHNPALVRAMVLPEKAAYYWRDEEGIVRIVDDRAAAPREAKTLDDEKTVLTLTAEEAERLGFARIHSGGSRDLGEAMGIEGWRKRSGYGEAAMRKASRRAESRGTSQDALVKRFGSVVEVINRTLEEANAAAPENVRLTYYRESGLLTSGSQRRWQKATDECVRLWEQVIDGLREVHRLQKEIEKIGLEAPVEDLDLRDIGDRAQRRLEELRKNRDRRYF